MTATNEVDAILCQEELPDEFCRLASNLYQSDHSTPAALVSGIVPTGEDSVLCLVMLRRHLVVPAFWPSNP